MNRRKILKNQEFTWSLANLTTCKEAFNISFSYQLNGDLNKELLNTSINKVLNQHSGLQLQFKYQEGIVLSQRKDNENLKTIIIDLDINFDEKQALKIVEQKTNIPFDVNGSDLIYVRLFTFKDQKSILTFTFHSVLIDKKAAQQFIKLVSQDYNALLNKNANTPPSIQTDYFEVVEKLNSYHNTEAFKLQLEDWLTRFPNSNEKLNLPTDYAEGTALDLSGKSVKYSLEGVFNSNTKFEINSDYKKEIISLAGYATLLHRLSNQDIIIVGVPKSIYNSTEVLGNFENTLPIHIDFSSSPNLNDLILQIENNLIFKEGYEQVPYSVLVESSKTKKDLNINQYFQTSFSFDKREDVYFGPEKAKDLFIESKGARLDLKFELLQSSEQLDLIVEYNTNIFSSSSIDRWVKVYKKILNGLLDNPTCPSDEIDILIQEDSKFLHELNNTNESFEDALCIHSYLEKWADRAPDNIALYWGNTQITYNQLNEEANKLAHLLTLKFDPKNKIIAVCMERCPDMLISIFATLKCGATYLPIDPNAPIDRTKSILADADPAVVLTKSEYETNFTDSKRVVLTLDTIQKEIKECGKENLNLDFSSDTSSYIIYTSGSTGMPKGVVIKHQSVLNRIGWMQKKYPIKQSDILIQKTPITFDVSVWELFWWSFEGASLVLLKPEFEKEPAKLLNAISTYGVTNIHFVPSMFSAFSTYIDAFEMQNHLKTLHRIFLSGEALQPESVNQFYNLIKRHTDIKLINLYGPTEATVDVSYFDCDLHSNHSKIYIGKPIDNTQLWVVNRKNKIQPVGVQGELIISGTNLAKGYLNRPQLNNEKFINVSIAGVDTRVYKTGDIAKWDSVGEIDYLGRLDNQVKIRGFRIELGEIEARLAEFPSIESCAVIVNKDNPDNPVLESYIKLTSKSQEFNKSEVVDFLTGKLPPYMIPSNFIQITEIPMTSSGKLDRKALILYKEKNKPSVDSIENDIEVVLLKIWKEVLLQDQIDTSDNFFDIGGNSIMIPHIQSKLLKEYQLKVETVDIFQYPTIKTLSSFLNIKYNKKSAIESIDKNLEVEKKSNTSTGHEIAIVGIGGKFPKADTIEVFWKNLCDNKESLQFFTDEQLSKNDVTYSQNKENPNYIKSRGVLNNIAEWDARFFGYSPNDARHTDPQQRLWFETVWNALEDAGIDPFTHSGDIGVFAGVNLNSYLFDNILRNRALYEDYMHFSNAETFHTYINNDAAFIATRTAYLFNLRGPAINVQTACSTSLTAVAQACSSLVSGDSDVAIAGASSVQTPQEIGYVYQTGSMRSADGHCRPFDKDASGTVFSNAVGAVVLKRLDDAVKDNDEIYGVIRGWALNNDGNDKIGFAAPSVNGQVELLKKAHKHANVKPDEIGYIEAHGTGTIMGDPIEASALIQSFREKTSKRQFCGIGSAKGNFGHTDEVAGMVGLIKAALSVHHKVIPATINYASPNPNIDFENSPFYVTDKNMEWSEDKSMIIGVSSFGVGGTNAHVILEQFQKDDKTTQNYSTDEPQLLVVSGKTDKSLHKNIENLVEFVSNSNDNIDIRDIAYTTQLRKSHFQKKAFATITTNKKIEVKSFKLGAHTNKTKKKVFLFPGQGAQFVNMGVELYDNAPLFKKWVDKGFEIYQRETGNDLKQLVFSEITGENSKLHNTEFTQPALFIVSFATAKLYESYGIFADESIGHSIGEYASACLAGVFDFETALKIVIKRGKLMQSVPNGSMMAVRIDAQGLNDIKRDYFEIAAVNAPMSCTICFKNANTQKVSRLLDKNKIDYILLNTSHAFHSSQFDIILEEFEGYVNTFKLNLPKTAFMSCSSGDYAKGEEVITGKYWAHQLRKTVLFSAGIEKVVEKKDAILLEVGPNTHLSSLTRQNNNITANTKIIHSIGRLPAGNSYKTFLNSIGELWLNGIHPDFKQFYTLQQPNMVKLPHYAFDKARYWIDIDHKKLGNLMDSSYNMEDVIIEQENPKKEVSEEKLQSKKLTNTQKRLVAIWNKALGTSHIDIDESFFEMGGHSLLAVSLVDEIQKEFGVKIILKDFFENPTIAHLENLIKLEHPEIELKSSTKKGFFQKIKISTSKKLIKGEI